MIPEQTRDPRSPALAEAHSVLASEALKTLTAKTQEIAQAHPDAARELQPPQGEYKYDIKIDIAGFLYTIVNVTFPNNYNSHFFGEGGGFSFGASVTWGTAWLNYPIEQLIGRKARFELNYWAVATNINWWGMNGETIGSALGGGLGLGAGIVGGEGEFKSL